MKILIAPDKFKGSCTSSAAAGAIARGLHAVWPDAELVLAPIADGGEGFAEALHSGLGGVWVKVEVADPLGRPIEGRYLWIEAQKLAVIEVSDASGLLRVPAAERDALRASSFGTGELMRHAARRGAAKLLVGLGGSATSDGGGGIAAALGYEFVTPHGVERDFATAEWRDLARLDATHAVKLPEVIAAADVQNPLLGPRGAARVFSPQKGADPAAVEELERRLAHLADLVQHDLGCDFREVAGAGAAGGIGFGLLSFCGAQIRSGFDVVAEALGLEALVQKCDLVFTGEGRIDDQTLEGKGPAGVAHLARSHGKPVIAFAGSVAHAVGFDEVFDATVGVIDEPVTLGEAMDRGEEFLARAAARTGRLLRAGRILPRVG